MTYIKLTQTINEISSKINKAIAEDFSRTIRNNKQRIESSCKNLASDSISSQPEMLALKSGNLSGEFGLYPGSESSAASAIASAVSSSVEVKIKNINSSLSNIPLTIYFQPSTFTNLLSLDQGHVKYRGGDLHWLNWLISLGDSVIVSGYQYEPSSGRGRSNLGYMSSGGYFKVPSEFSGTMDDNFVTRALTSPQFTSALSTSISNILS